MKKLIKLFMSICLILLIMGHENVKADDEQIEEKLENKINEVTICLNKVGLSDDSYSIVNEEPIVLDGEMHNLFVVFKSNKNALEEFKSEPEYVYLKNKYTLPELKEDNWELYYQKSQIDLFNEVDLNKNKVLCFFDTFENIYQNKIIYNLNKQLNTRNVSAEKELIKTIKLLLPEERGSSEKVYVKNNSKSRTLNITAMSNYANRYVINPNPTFLLYAQDCCNFVSQILYAGGLEYTNLWYPYSISWYNCWYLSGALGISMRTNNLLTFSSTIEIGDIVLGDTNNDGEYNHAGYVIDKGSYGTYNGKSYYNFKIAQHSPNYLYWASHDSNNWENNTGYYAILTRY